MLKRQKWKEAEDQLLTELVGQFKSSPIDWSHISQELARRGVKKQARQARERWSNHLDPSLERDSLDSTQNRKLFELHSSAGNSWKRIASEFPGRSDNNIKNQFFAMVRKSLRKARKALKQSLNTAQVNRIKPKMLAKFLTLSLPVPPHLRVSDPNFPWSAKDPLRVREFVLFFLETKSSQIERDLTPKITALIQFVIDALENQNETYCNAPDNQSRRKRKITKNPSPKRNPNPQPSPNTSPLKISPNKISAEGKRDLQFLTSLPTTEARWAPRPESENYQILQLNRNISDLMSPERDLMRPTDRFFDPPYNLAEEHLSNKRFSRQASYSRLVPERTGFEDEVTKLQEEPPLVKKQSKESQNSQQSLRFVTKRTI